MLFYPGFQKNVPVGVFFAVVVVVFLACLCYFFCFVPLVAFY